MRFLWCSVMIALFGLCTSNAQISPGPLSKAHSDLEGISNCTQCHESGQEISGTKCLSCHSEIKTQISSGHGFHFANSTSPCITCHKEHLGRDVKITRFDETQFDHSKTGFLLSGKHGTVKCEQCHDSRYIRNEEITKSLATIPRKTFLGLDQQCVSCHQDRHRGTVDTQCQSCHTAKMWSPAEGFDHGKTKFAIIGKHKPVPCVKCHEGLSKKVPPEPVLFSTKSFADCTPCHNSPHGSKFSDKVCRSCHTPEGWSRVASFNHTETPFPLVGKHATAACEKCHTEMNIRKDGAVSFVTKRYQDCIPCHATHHNSKFSNVQCKSCHTPTAWNTLVVDRFNHDLTNYALAGRHAELQCGQCHKASTTAGFSQKFLLLHKRCTDCHVDYHNGQFAEKYSNDCALCHTEKSYKPSTFSIVRHAEARFQLSGAHVATPCEVCHKKPGQKEPVFRFADIRCESCHADVHKGQFTSQMKERSCGQCHSTKEWNMASFDHGKTRFPLIGRHVRAKCVDCHKEKIVDGLKSVQYRGLSSDCQSCHDEIHGGQFAINGVTDCAVCHTSRGWHSLIFNHETQSSFRLTGAHKNIACAGCHKEEKSGVQTIVRYKPLASQCESCHKGVK
jgi:hypothetical protein